MFTVKRGKHILSKHDTEAQAIAVATPECQVIQHTRNRRRKGKWFVVYNECRYLSEPTTNFPYFYNTPRITEAMPLSFEEARRYVEAWKNLGRGGQLSMVKCTS